MSLSVGFRLGAGFLALVGSVGVIQAASPRPSVTAQESEWVSLLAVPGEGVDIRYQLSKTDAGWSVAFKNFGTRRVHFGAYLAGLQEREQAFQNGRLHAASKRLAGTIEVVSTGAAPVPTPVLFEIRLDEDQGPFWRD